MTSGLQEYNSIAEIFNLFGYMALQIYDNDKINKFALFTEHTALSLINNESCTHRLKTPSIV